MSFRYNETSRFPVGFNTRGVWYAIVYFEAALGKFQELSFTESKSGRIGFAIKMKELDASGIKYEALGIWQGQWKTDIFVLDPVVVIPMLEAS